MSRRTCNQSQTSCSWCAGVKHITPEVHPKINKIIMSSTRNYFCFKHTIFFRVSSMSSFVPSSGSSSEGCLIKQLLSKWNISSLDMKPSVLRSYTWKQTRSTKNMDILIYFWSIKSVFFNPNFIYIKMFFEVCECNSTPLNTNKIECLEKCYL